MNTSVMQLFQAMADGAIVITPNKRLAHELHQRFIQTSTQRILPKPNCYPYQDFIQLCWNAFQLSDTKFNHPKLLTPLQTSFLWEQACPDYRSDSTTLPRARELFSAWRMAQWWELPTEAYSPHKDDSFSLLAHWSERFEQLLKHHHVITDAQLVTYMATFSAPPSLPHLNLLTTRLIFVCFDDFHPQQKTLQTLLRLNYQVDILDFLDSNQQPLVYPAQDHLDERDAIAEWIHHHTDSSKTMALIVPDLNQQGVALQRWLSVFFPQLTLHFSLGKPFLDYPMVDHAWNLLEFDSSKCTMQQAKWLLQSHWISCSPEERDHRFQFLADYSDFKTMQFNQERWDHLLPQRCPELFAALQRSRPYPAQASMSDWSQLWLQRLIDFGFPGSQALNSENYQLYQRFIELLRQLKTLSRFSSLLNKSDAFSWLRRLLQQSIFQAQPNQPCRLHVLGLLEAAGSFYDAIWIMNLTDTQFPAALSPSAWLPLELQTMHQMPHTDAGKEEALALVKLKRFAALSSSLILSYPQIAHDREHRPSMLLKYHATYLRPSPHELLQNQNTPQWEHHQDSTQIAVASEERLSQSSFLLAEYAKCPFRAFASMRLKLKPLEPIMLGLSPPVKGKILHHTLELFWQKFASQTELKNTEASIIHQHIDVCIRQALKHAQAHQYQHESLLALEKDRLFRLIQSSLTWELARPSFEIHGLEVQHQFELGPMKFSLRVDRMDRVDESKLWIIDYKTSLPSPLPWNDHQALEPQLLLYALLDPDIQAILFHELKKGHSLIRGIGDDNAQAQGISSPPGDRTWEEQRQQWHDYLLKLATDFYEGHAEPKPRQAQLCQSCHYAGLCRQPLSHRAYHV
jgi:ATP-dependent helicase/nuclease subunit B